AESCSRAPVRDSPEHEHADDRNGKLLSHQAPDAEADKSKAHSDYRSNTDRDEGTQSKGAEAELPRHNCSLDEVETANRNRERKDGEDRRETRFPDRVRDRNRETRHDRGQEEADGDVH